MKNRYLRYITVIFLTLFLATSCSEGDRYVEPPEVANLTLIFYMGGDNNGLSGETFQKINNIANANMEALRNEDANIFIYQDHTKGVDVRPTLWRVKYSKNALKNDNTTPFYELSTLEIIEQYDEQNSASGETLRAVIERCMELGRAQHYGLWAFSHGSGWMPAGTLGYPHAPSADYITPNTIIQDGNDYMELADFAKAIPDRTFDFILFESCFTGGIEVAYELRNKSDYLIISPTKMLSPGYRDIYKDVLPTLFKPWKDSDPIENLRAAAQIYFNYWNGQSAESYRSATISVIKTGKLEELATVVRDISKSGNALTDDEMLTIQQFDRYYPNLYFDFGHYFSTLATTDGQRSQLKAAIDNVAVYKNATPWFFLGTIGALEIKHYSGMTTYVPQSRYPFLNEEYKKLEWTKAITTE